MPAGKASRLQSRSQLLNTAWIFHQRYQIKRRIFLNVKSRARRIREISPIPEKFRPDISRTISLTIRIVFQWSPHQSCSSRRTIIALKYNLLGSVRTSAIFLCDPAREVTSLWSVGGNDRSRNARHQITTTGVLRLIESSSFSNVNQLSRARVIAVGDDFN